MPLLRFMLNHINKLSDRQQHTNEVMAARCNHRHNPAGVATFTLPTG